MLIDTGSNRTIIRSNVINIHDQRYGRIKKSSKIIIYIIKQQLYNRNFNLIKIKIFGYLILVRRIQKIIIKYQKKIIFFINILNWNLILLEKKN
jgi:hypothetical protein